MRRLAQYLVVAISTSFLIISFNTFAELSSKPTCTSNTLQTLEVFDCIGRKELPPLEFSPPQSYLDPTIRSAFPTHWHQLGNNQRHNPVFDVSDNAPDFLKSGIIWSTPIAGLDYIRLAQAKDSVGNDEAWGSRTAQYLGNVVGASVAQGMVFVPLGRHEIWALDAANGRPIWQADVPTAAGMGQILVDEINGRLTAFVPVGDAAFTIHNVIDFANGKPHDRGGSFTGLYAFDAVTGEKLWRFATKGAIRPTPVYRDGKLYLATNGGEFFTLDAGTGTQLGSFTNPGEGITGLASLNWYETNDKRLLFIYGTIRPRRILAVDATNPTQPILSWSYTPPNATANAPGDTTVAVDPELGMVFTTVFSSVAGKFTTNILALDATTGTLLWNDFAGGIDSPPGYKGSVPLVHEGMLYVGNTSNGSYRAYKALSGEFLWEADLAEGDDPFIHRPRAAPVFYDGKLILAEGRDIHTFDPNTGDELNRFETPGNFSRWGINQPVIVGKLIILSSPSGWVFAAPVDLITRLPGFEDITPSLVPAVDTPLPAQHPDFYNPRALPHHNEAAPFPDTWLAYAGGQDHNGVRAQGPWGVSWQTALRDALPLDASPLDESLLGTEVAIQMTHWAFGVGTGVSPAGGIIYVGGNRYSISALNALTGEPIWRFRTLNANFAQPIVTSNTVVVGSGDPWMNLGNTGRFRANSPATFIGDSFATVYGLDPKTGIEKWRVFSGNGTSAITPLYHKGNLYWVNGEAKVWAVNADTGQPVAPFMTSEGLPTLSLGGFNAISSANIYHVPEGPDLMIVGTAMPNRIWAIELQTATVYWSYAAPEINSYITGFAATSLAVQQNKGLLTGTVLADANIVTNTADILAFALDGKTGKLLWTQSLGISSIPKGFTSPVPLIHKNSIYIHNPLTQNITSLNTDTGAIQWQTPITAPVGKYSWAPGVVVRNHLIVPAGPYLYTLNPKTGAIVGRFSIGGSMTYNSPSVVGKTLYIGNSWGWVSAIPLYRLLK